MRLKHAFIVAAHAYPQLLEHNIKMLEADNHFFFVHVDKKTKDMAPWQAVADNHKNVVLLQERMQVNWGGQSQILVTIRLLQAAYECRYFDYVHFISGQDIALCAANEFDERFAKSEGKSYMLYARMQANIEFRLRHFFTHDYIDHLKKYAYPVKALERLVALFVWRPGLDMEVKSGSLWFSLHSKVVDYLLKYLDRHPEYLERYRWTACADELFFHTLLWPVRDELDIRTDCNLRYIDWSAAGSHPQTLTVEDYPKIYSTDSVFARKVHPEKSAKLIEKIFSRNEV